MVSQHALQVSRPIPRGELEGSGRGVLQAHTQGGSLRGLTWGRGLQAHTQKGVYPSMHGGRPPPPADVYCCGWYTSYWNAFLFR